MIPAADGDTDAAALGRLRRGLIGGTTVGLSAKVASVASTFATTVLLTRLLPAADVGAYFVLVSLALLVSAVVQLGVPSAFLMLVFPVGRARRRASSVLAAAVRTSATLIVWPTLAVAGPVGAWLLPVVGVETNGLEVRVAAAALLPAIVLQRLLSEALRSVDAAGAAAFAGGPLGVVFATAGFGAAWWVDLSFDVTRALATFVAGVLLSNVVGALLFMRSARRHDDAASTGRLSTREILSISLPFGASHALALSAAELVPILVGALAGAEEAAVFGIAVRFVNLGQIPMVAVRGAALYWIARLLSEQARDRLQRLLTTTATVATFGSLVFGGVILAAGPFVIGEIYGDTYGADLVLLATLLAGHLALVATGWCAQLLGLTGHQPMVVRSHVLGTVLLTVVAVVAVPSLGSLGGALAATSGLVVQNGLLAVRAVDSTGFTTWARLRGMSTVGADLRALWSASPMTAPSGENRTAEGQYGHRR